MNSLFLHRTWKRTFSPPNCGFHISFCFFGSCWLLFYRRKLNFFVSTHPHIRTFIYGLRYITQTNTFKHQIHFCSHLILARCYCGGLRVSCAIVANRQLDNFFVCERQQNGSLYVFSELIIFSYISYEGAYKMFRQIEHRTNLEIKQDKTKIEYSKQQQQHSIIRALIF